MRRERALQRIQVKSKILTRHSGARAKPASPESITTAGGYGFRPSPLSRLGRNDKLNGLILHDARVAFAHVGRFAATQEVVAGRHEEIDHLGVFAEPCLVQRTSR